MWKVFKSTPFERILIICTRQIGDVLLTTPLIRAAKARWPQAQIDVLGFKGTLGMLQGNPDVHALVEVMPGSGWLQSWSLIRRLWRRYDLALIAEHTDRAHLYGWIAARVRSGQVPLDAKAWWKRLLLTHPVPWQSTHAVLNKLRLLEPWVPHPQAHLVAPRADALPPDLMHALVSRYVVMHVPSLVRYKQWPLPHFAWLARALADEGIQVVLSGGPTPADQAAVAEVADAAASPLVLNTAGQLSLNQLTQLLKGAAAYVGPDTSITHLATACGTPVIALYGPISPVLWGPWPGGSEAQYEHRALRQQRGKVIVLQGPPACVPCNRAGCENHNASRSECLETLEPQRVLDEVHRVLEEAQR